MVGAVGTCCASVGCLQTVGNLEMTYKKKSGVMMENSGISCIESTFQLGESHHNNNVESSVPKNLVYLLFNFSSISFSIIL